MKLAQGDLSALQQRCGGTEEIRALRRTMASMAGHVQRAQAEGMTFRHALTDGQEAERARIAHELHDDTVQSLVAIALMDKRIRIDTMKEGHIWITHRRGTRCRIGNAEKPF